MKDIELECIKELTEKAKSLGYEVFSPKKLTSYFFFTKENKIGYCQFDRIRGVSFTTVHFPSTSCGTGFNASSFEEALSYAPAWAGPNPSGVVKYKSWDHFVKNYWQPLVQR